MEIIKGIIAPFVGIFTFLRSLFIQRVRLNYKKAFRLYSLLKKEGHSFVMERDFSENKLPSIYRSLSVLRGIFFYFSITERLLRAGMSGLDAVADVVLMRWNISKMQKLLEVVEDSDSVDVYILKPWDAERIASLNCKSRLDKPLMDRLLLANIETEVCDVITCEKNKTGILVYGSPGNGKTYLIKYLSNKYKLPIYLVTLTPDLDNHSILRMFGHIKGPAIILFEDFDSYFDKRKTLNKEFKFTLDVLLNIFDGVYSNPDNLIFIMTANDINKIDPAIKTRPSRFRIVEEIKNPSKNIIERIFKNSNLSKKDMQDIFKSNKSLDQLLYEKEIRGI